MSLFKKALEVSGSIAKGMIERGSEQAEALKWMRECSDEELEKYTGFFSKGSSAEKTVARAILNNRKKR